MKKIFISFLVILFLGVNINFTYSFNKNNIANDYLINYINIKLNDIEKIKKKYNLNYSNLNQKIKELQELKSILIKSRNNNYYNKYTKNITKKLREINDYLKIYLKKKIEKKKKEAKKYSIIYLKRIKPIINKINDIIVNIALKLKQKSKLNHKDKQIINILYQIKQKLNTLENITNKNFNTKKDLQDYIINNFKQIKFQFNQIKNIIKK